MHSVPPDAGDGDDAPGDVPDDSGEANGGVLSMRLAHPVGGGTGMQWTTTTTDGCQTGRRVVGWWGRCRRHPTPPPAMCGRFTLTNNGPDIAAYFDIREVPRVTPRWNIAPTQPVLVARAPAHTAELAEVLWGLVPSFASDPGVAAKMINARSETVDTKPAFRDAFRSRRCIFPASGFYEWTAAGKRKRQPWYITLRDQPLMPLAGLWESWRAPDGSRIETACILTTACNQLMARMHDRMPVILRPAQFTQWLDPDQDDADEVKKLIGQYDPAAMTLHAVSMRVNNARQDDVDPSLIEPIDLPLPPAPGDEPPTRPGRQRELF